MANVTGQDDVMRNLLALARQFPEQVASSLRTELEIESTESQRRTPVEFGHLRGSHRVTVEGAGTEVTGAITVGGPAAPYAIYVHENPDAHHPIGQWKFLESTVMESAKYFPARLAARITLER